MIFLLLLATFDRRKYGGIEKGYHEIKLSVGQRMNMESSLMKANSELDPENRQIPVKILKFEEKVENEIKYFRTTYEQVGYDTWVIVESYNTETEEINELYKQKIDPRKIEREL